MVRKLWDGKYIYFQFLGAITDKFTDEEVVNYARFLARVWAPGGTIRYNNFKTSWLHSFCKFFELFGVRFKVQICISNKGKIFESSVEVFENGD